VKLLGQFSDIPNQNQANEALNGSLTVLCTHKSTNDHAYHFM